MKKKNIKSTHFNLPKDLVQTENKEISMERIAIALACLYKTITIICNIDCYVCVFCIMCVGMCFYFFSQFVCFSLFVVCCV